MTVKLGWGARIALLYGTFVVLMVILVARSMNQDFDLVAKDYYAKEIAYQQQIDAGKNQSGLSAPVRLTAGEAEVAVDFPQEFAGKVLQADIHFYSPVKTSLDRRFERKVEGNHLSFRRSELQDVFYKCKISWTSDGVQYYQESDINLTR
ncbi:MAG: FixH family protein [Flavipsychrobacter sp.]|nr:FixH family protein [Flavipsychrobacter sp.]